MDYTETFNSLMSNMVGNDTPQTEAPAPGINNQQKTDNSLTTVYDDLRLTITNEKFTEVGLNNETRIFVYTNDNQNAIYLTNKNNIGDGFGIAKIIKHTPNKGLRLNVSKILNIGSIPSEMIIQTNDGMLKIYPKDGINRVPAKKAYQTVEDMIQKLYNCSVSEWCDMFMKGLIK